MIRVAFLLVIAAFFLCSRDVVAQPDSLRHLDVLCGNDQPMPSVWDSLYGPWPALTEDARWAVVSPDLRFLAFHYEQLMDFPFLSGVQLYDLHNRRKIVFIPGQFTSCWHPFEHKLVTSHYVYNVDNDEILPLPVETNGQSLWSPDGKYIYYQIGVGKNALFRSTATGADTGYIENLKMYSYPVTDSTFFSFTSNGILLSNMNTNTKAEYDLRWMHDVNPRDISNVSVSPDGRHVLADFWPANAGRYDNKKFLGMVDLRTYMLKEILPAQRLGNEYYPSFTHRNTIIISYVCRTDSIRGIWEIDTNGVFLRQIFGKDQFQELNTGTDPETVVPSGPSIVSFYPQPGGRDAVIEFTVADAGTYSLHLIDLGGRALRCFEDAVQRASGMHRVALTLNGIPPGMYLIRLSSGQHRPVYQRVVIGQ
jgi:hypothetical protein